MKTLICAVNSKFIHSSYSIRTLSAYAKSKGQEISQYETNITVPIDRALRDILSQEPELLGFSLYIWNIDYVMKLVSSIKKVNSKIFIVLGGSEASFEYGSLFAKGVDAVVSGEGEKAFSMLISRLTECEADFSKADLNGIPGLALPEKTLLPAEAVELSEIPFSYEDVNIEKGKILYYQSSRGCPFSCAYCLSENRGYEKLRFLPLERVFSDLGFFIKERVPLVKFIDRTFNCGERAKEIWKFLINNDNGVTRFHFEISAELLNEEDISVIRSAREGLFQFEIGIQSTNEKTLDAVSRHTDKTKLFANIKRLKNIHLDLIAGLPEEGLDSFRKSFNEVYALKPDMLQLGFLKVLKGTKLRENKDIRYADYPPYEVLSTKWLSFDEIAEIKSVEMSLDRFYNADGFRRSIGYLEKFFDSPYEMYLQLAGFMARNGQDAVSLSLMTKYRTLYDFGMEPADSDLLCDALRLDLAEKEPMRTLPEWLGAENDKKRKG